MKSKEQTSFTDERDGHVYKTVKIGNQTWMAENLNFEMVGSMCYDNNPDFCDEYGRLYTWETAQRACPVGWGLPSKEDFEKLFSIAETELIKYLKKKYGKRYESYDPGSSDGRRAKALSNFEAKASDDFRGSDIFSFSIRSAGSRMGHNSKYRGLTSHAYL